MPWIQEKFFGVPERTKSTSAIYAQTPEVSEVSQVKFEDIPAGYTYRWKQEFELPLGVYKFTVTADDGIRLYVDGVIQIDAWKDQSPTEYSTLVNVTKSPTLITIEYYNYKGLGVAKFDYVKWEGNIPDQTPVSTTAPAPVTGTTQTTVPTNSSVDLSTIIEFSKLFTERTYIKNTLNPINKDTLKISNNSTTITAFVSFTTVPGVKFVPSSVTLGPDEHKNVEIQFDPSVINGFNEGITDLDCVISISSNTQVTTPEVTVIKPPVLPPPPPPLPPEPPVIVPPENDVIVPEVPSESRIKSITITPAYAETQIGGGTVAYSATVVADVGADTSVKWSLSKSGFAHIDNFGVVTPKTVSGVATVIATSVEDPTMVAYAKLNIAEEVIIEQVPATPEPVEKPFLGNRFTGETIVIQTGDGPVSIDPEDEYTCYRVGEVTRQYTNYNTGRLIRCTVEQSPQGGCVEICRDHGMSTEVANPRTPIIPLEDNDKGALDTLTGTIVSATPVENKTYVSRGKTMYIPKELD